MASAALSMRLPRARFMASGSASTSGRSGARFGMRRMFCRRPAKRASEFSTMVLRSAGRGCARGELGERGELVDQRAHVSTAELMTSLERRMTAMEATRAGRRRGCAQAVDVAMDVLGGEGDGGERVLDLVRDAAGDLAPGGLLLCAEQLGGVLQHQDVAVVVAVGSHRLFPAGRRWPAEHGAAAAGAGSRHRHLHLAGGRAHTMAAAQQAVERLHGLGGEDRFDVAADEVRLAAGLHHLRQRAVGQHDTALGVQCDNAVGDGLQHGLELGAARFQGGVGGGELRLVVSTARRLRSRSAAMWLKLRTSSPSSSVALSPTRWA